MSLYNQKTERYHDSVFLDTASTKDDNEAGVEVQTLLSSALAGLFVESDRRLKQSKYGY